MTTPMMSASGLVMPARNRGFWLSMAAKSVLPARGSPEMKLNFRAGFATWGAAGMQALSYRSVMWIVQKRPAGASGGWYAQRTRVTKARPDSMSGCLPGPAPVLHGDRSALSWNVPSAYLDDRQR